MSPILIKLGSLEIRWYSVLILIAFVIGYLLVLKRGQKKGISKAHINDMAFYLVIVCILGARLYYCLFNFDYYKSNLIDILKVWQGGLAIHGGIIAGIVFLLIYTKKYKIKFLEMADIIAPALALGQAIGRWGNFFNQEAYGPATTFFELKRLHVPNFVIDGMYINGTVHHPTFFYESVGCLLIFILIMILRNIKNIKIGQMTGLYFVLYGTLRYYIEALRTDSLMLNSFRVAQIISIIMFVIGILMLIIPVIRRKND